MSARRLRHTSGGRGTRCIGRTIGAQPACTGIDRAAGRVAAWESGEPDRRSSDVFTYLRGHLPGAAYLNTETLRATEGGVPAQLLPARTYRDLFSRLGLRFDQPVVIYSAGETGNIDATFLAWLLAGFGHPKVYVLNGGYFKWELEHRPVVQQYPRITAVTFPSNPFSPERASLEDVRRASPPTMPFWWMPGLRPSMRERPELKSVAGISPEPSATIGRTILPRWALATSGRARPSFGPATGLKGSRRTRTSSPTATAPPKRATFTSRCDICWVIPRYASMWARGRSGRNGSTCRLRRGSGEAGSGEVGCLDHGGSTPEWWHSEQHEGAEA